MIRLKIELEGDGEVVEALADALREFFNVARPPAKPEPIPFSRLENIPPATNIAPRPRIRRNGLSHHQDEE
jgi:hypothetical protein